MQNLKVIEEGTQSSPPARIKGKLEEIVQSRYVYRLNNDLVCFFNAVRDKRALIAGAPTSVATFPQLLNETAMGSGEAIKLRWKDTDLENRLITLNEPEKGSLPRQWNNPSQKLMDMLNAMPRNYVRVFGSYTLSSLKAMFSRARKRMATKLQNPRLLDIHLHTLRHWKATMEYHKTKDLLHVMAFLGHKKCDNTLLYVQLDEKLFRDRDDQFTVKTVHNAEEAVKLGEIGFEPFDTIDGMHLYRKRK